MKAKFVGRGSIFFLRTAEIIVKNRQASGQPIACQV